MPEKLALRRSGLLLFFAQAQNQKPVTIFTIDRSMFYGTGKLNHLFESAVGNLELIMRHAFAASSVAPRSADAQHRPVDGDIDIGGLDAGQVDFHNPAVAGDRKSVVW